jgi:Fic family protein
MSRRYLSTHPWITFRADLSRAPVSLWLLLGEARSKCEHVAGVPLQPEIAQRLFTMYLVKGVHATTAIEGNTLSEEDIARHLSGELQVPPSKEYQKKEVDNLVQAFNAIVEAVKDRGPRERITPDLICHLNHAVLRDLELEDAVIPGRVRKHSVGVLRYPGAPYEDCELLLDRLCRWLNEESFDGEGSFGMAAAILKAILAHLYIAWIHPFGDGNGRTARLLEFYLLVNAGVSVPSAHLLSDHYNQTRPEYYRYLDHASRSGGDIVPFLHYATAGFVEELREQLKVIREQQWALAWRDFVSERFDEDASSTTSLRRKYLVLDLSWQKEPVPRGRLALLSPRVAQGYARKTEKTLSRDIDALSQEGFIERVAGGYRARTELILAFLPPSWPRQAEAASEVPAAPGAPIS